MKKFFMQWLCKFRQAKKSETIESITFDFKITGDNKVRRKFVIPVGEKMSEADLKAFMQRIKAPVDVETDITLPEPSDDLKMKFKSDYFL